MAKTTERPRRIPRASQHPATPTGTTAGDAKEATTVAKKTDRARHTYIIS